MIDAFFDRLNTALFLPPTTRTDKSMQVKVFTHQSARCLCRYLEGIGVLEVVYAGILNSTALRSLRGQLVPYMRGFPAIVLRYDRGVIVTSSDYMTADLTLFEPGDPPAVLVVPQDHYEHAKTYVKPLLNSGIYRAVLSDRADHLALAYVLASRQGGLGRRESLGWPRYRPALDPLGW